MIDNNVDTKYRRFYLFSERDAWIHDNSFSLRFIHSCTESDCLQRQYVIDIIFTSVTDIDIILSPQCHRPGPSHGQSVAQVSSTIYEKTLSSMGHNNVMCIGANRPILR